MRERERKGKREREKEGDTQTDRQTDIATTRHRHWLNVFMKLLAQMGLARFQGMSLVQKQRDERRHAQRAVIQAIAKLPAGPHMNTGAAYMVKPVLFIELMTGTGSKFAATFGRLDYVLRIVQPRRGPRTRKSKPRLLAKYLPPKAPRIGRGVTAMWRLDLRVASHQKAFFVFLERMRVSVGVQVAHEQSSHILILFLSFLFSLSRSRSRVASYTRLFSYVLATNPEIVPSRHRRTGLKTLQAQPLVTASDTQVYPLTPGNITCV